MRHFTLTQRIDQLLANIRRKLKTTNEENLCDTDEDIEMLFTELSKNTVIADD